MVEDVEQPSTRLRFRRWRRSRPFWAGAWTIFAGLEILSIPLLPVSDFVSAAIAGASSVLVGLVILVLGLFLWYSPRNRTLAGVLTLIFSIASMVLSNLGGLVLGMVCGIIGGALALAWTDRPRPGRGTPAGQEQPLDQEPVEDQVDEPAPVTPSPRPRAADFSLSGRSGVLGSAIAVLGAVVALAVPQVAVADPLPLPPGTPVPGPRAETPPCAPVGQPPLIDLGGLLPGLRATTLAPCPAAPPTRPPLPLPIPLPLPVPVPSPPSTPGLPAMPPPAAQPVPTGPAQPTTEQQRLAERLLAGRAPVSAAAMAVAPGYRAPVRRSKLTMATLDVTGLVFQGLVDLPTATGSVRVMRFTIANIDADGLTLTHAAADGGLSLRHTLGQHVLGDQVVLDCTKLSLVALGILPLTFSVDGLVPPPGLAIPIRLPTTAVDVDLVTLRIGTLSVPTAVATIGFGGSDRGPATGANPAAAR